MRRARQGSDDDGRCTDLTTNYFYDSEGNLACSTTGAGTEADCTTAEGAATSANLLARYAYDPLNRLQSFRSWKGGTLTSSSSYVADALDRVGAQTEWHQGVGTRKTTFSYLGLSTEVSEERHENEAGGLIRTKSYGYDALEQRFGIAVNEASGASSRYSYGRNVHGDISLLVDQAGAAKASYGYTPYGDEDGKLTRGDALKADGSKDPLNPFRFNDKRYDTGSGSIDMGARRFGPDLGRFLQRDLYHGALSDLDLSADPLTGNRYAFAGGNPISFVEVDGHRVSRHSTSCVGVGRLDCSLRAWTKSSWKQRSNWLGAIRKRVNLGGWLNIFEGTLKFFRDSPTFANSEVMKTADAVVLWVAARGLRLNLNSSRITLREWQRERKTPAVARWDEFFFGLAARGSGYKVTDRELERAWAIAEQTGVNMGVRFVQQLLRRGHLHWKSSFERKLFYRVKERTDELRRAMRDGRSLKIAPGLSFDPDPRYSSQQAYRLGGLLERCLRYRIPFAC